MRPLLPALLALVACGKDKGDTTEADDAAVTWHRDVQPIVAKNCAACHSAGGVGGVELTDYATAKDWSSAMASYVAGGVMPPPAADPTCRDYHGSEQTVLTAEEEALIAAWAEDGAPEGDPADAPAPVDWQQALERVDAEFALPQVHTIDPGSDGNEYYCYVVDNPFSVPTYITGFDVRLDNPAVVHHMVLAVDMGKNAGIQYGYDPEVAALPTGFPCADPIVESDWMLLHAWTPGQVPITMPEGYGLLVEPDDQIVLQMHYYDDSGVPQTDSSGYVVSTADAVETPVTMGVLGPDQFLIPAGDDAYTRQATYTNSWGIDLEILGVFPHMHWLGSGYSAVLAGEGGEEECIVQSDKYSFDHQGTYMFKEPAYWEPGETFTMGCTWDNSAENPYQYNDPPQDIRFGEATSEEMCFFLFYYAEK